MTEVSSHLLAALDDYMNGRSFSNAISTAELSSTEWYERDDCVWWTWKD